MRMSMSMSMTKTPTARLVPALALAAALVALAPLSPARAAGLSVDVTTPWAIPGHPVPVQLLVRAAAPTTLTVDVSCGEVRAHATFPVPAGAATRRTVLLPTLEPHAYGCSPRVAFTSSDGDEGVATGPIGPNALDYAILTPRPDDAGDAAYRLVDVAPDGLPDRWQGYPLGPTFIVTPAADDRLSPAQRAALATWSRAGGALVLVGDDDRLARWRALGAVPSLAGADPGAVITAALEAPTEVPDAAWDHRVPGTETVPVGGFLLVALAFAVLVGPLNFWWVIKKKRQRGLFFVTTPLLSFAACALLIGYNLLSEGLGVKRAAVQLSWLDGERHEAVHVTGVTLFAGTGVDRFTVGPDVLVRPLGGGDLGASVRYGGGGQPSGRARTIAWGEAGQELSGDWVPARVNEQLAFVAPEPDRRRLTLTAGPGDSYQLTNGLDVTVRQLIWYDLQTAAWALNAPLAPGASARLTRTAATPSRPPLGRLGPGAERLWWRAMAPLHAIAELSAPLGPIPGPAGSDEAPLEAWLLGPLAPPGVTAPDLPPPSAADRAKQLLEQFGPSGPPRLELKDMEVEVHP